MNSVSASYELHRVVALKPSGPRLRQAVRGFRWHTTTRSVNRSGAMLFMVAVVIVLFLLSAAFSINVAWMQLVDTELRCSTDNATRAGGEALARGLTTAQARTEIQQIAALNLVDGVPLIVRDEDIQFGFASVVQGERYDFDPSQGQSVNAVRVSGHRVNGVGSGAVSLPFTPFLRRNSFQASKFATATIQERDIVLVIDRSGSMSSRDAGRNPNGRGNLTRMEAVQLAVEIFRDVIDSTDGVEKLGLASYSTNSSKDVRLTFDYSDFDDAVSRLPTSGMTNIGAGIDDGVDLLLQPGRARPVASPVLVVLTDGVHNQRRDPERAARDAVARDGRIEIHTVTFSRGADQSRMRRVARDGNGRHHHADDFDELADVFDDIARTAGSVLIE